MLQEQAAAAKDTVEQGSGKAAAQASQGLQANLAQLKSLLGL